MSETKPEPACVMSVMLQALRRSLVFGMMLLLLNSLLAGCAFRSGSEQLHSRAKPYSFKYFNHLYSRNFIVATPTAVGNAVCGAVGSASFIAFIPSAYVNDAAIEMAMYPAVFAAHVCGAVVGFPFIPVSYICEEHPWYWPQEGFQVNWACHSS